MADVSLTAQFANALPVIIGGVLAIAGVLASQIAIHRLSDSPTRATVRRFEGNDSSL